MRGFALVAFTIAISSACGGKQAPPPAPPKVALAPKPPPPPPACVKAGAEMSAIGSAGADDGSAHFCISDGTDTNQCFTVALGDGKLDKATAPTAAQSPALGEARARVETTPTDVKVCATADDCKTIKPAVPKGAENPIEAVANAPGTIAVVLLGDAEKGKGTAEVWDVAKNKKLASIKYAKNDFKCGHARVLGESVFISADVCSGPAAHAVLYTSKGKRIADVGGKEFGSYGTEPVQVKDDTWAFLEENGAAIALQDVKTGKIVKTIDVGAVWAQQVAEAAPAAPPKGGPASEGEANAKKKPPADAGEASAPPTADEPAAPAMGNPGESVLVRGADGKLVVITGGPSPGNVAIVDVETGEAKVWHAKACK